MELVRVSREVRRHTFSHNCSPITITMALTQDMPFHFVSFFFVEI